MKCSRCQRIIPDVTDTETIKLCNICREGDALVEWFKEDALHDAHLYQEELDEKDRQSETHLKRYGH